MSDRRQPDPMLDEELTRLHRSDPTSFFGTALWNLMILELWHRGLESKGGGASAKPRSSG